MSGAWEKKTVLVTGCSSGGIGHALAREFHSRGTQIYFRYYDDCNAYDKIGLYVFATVRNKESIPELSALGIEALSLDVTSLENIAEVKRHVSQRTGGTLDYLVNNAGRTYCVPALDVDFSEVQNVFETNLFAIMRITQEFSPLLVQSKGTIINIGSVAAVMPYVFGSVYNASKATLHAYSDTLRIELAPSSVKVMVAITGGVQSNIARTQRELPQGSLYLPIDAEYQRRQTHSQEGAMSGEVYAQGLVNAALQPRPVKWVWRGAKVWLVWFLVNFAPKGVWDFYMPKMFGLDRLARVVQAKKKNS